jgi:hypothetical protein
MISDYFQFYILFIIYLLFYILVTPFEKSNSKKFRKILTGSSPEIAKQFKLENLAKPMTKNNNLLTTTSTKSTSLIAKNMHIFDKYVESYSVRNNVSKDLHQLYKKYAIPKRIV